MVKLENPISVYLLLYVLFGYEVSSALHSCHSLKIHHLHIKLNNSTYPLSLPSVCLLGTKLFGSFLPAVTNYILYLENVGL